VSDLEDDWNDLRPVSATVVPSTEVPFRCRIGWHKWVWKEGERTDEIVSDCQLCGKHREEHAG